MTPLSFQAHLSLYLLILLAYVITTTNAHTALVFGSSGTVGSEILRAIVSNPFWEEVVLVGRRFPPKINDLLKQQPIVVHQIQLSNLSNVQDNKELLDMFMTTKIDACFIAVGSGSPQDNNLKDWHSVEVDLVASMTRLCNKIQVKSVTLLSAVDSDDDPTPFTENELNADNNTKPLGWLKMVLKYTRMMGLKEMAVKEEAKNVPFVRIFRPNTIITKENRYGWVDWTFFKLHAILDPFLPTKYHSVQVGLLGEAMVNDAALILSTIDGGDGLSSKETKLTYGDFLNIIAKMSEGEEGVDTRNKQREEL